MRTRAIFYASILAFGLATAAASCQVVAGLTVLEIRPGGGGAGGTGGSTSATTTTTTTTAGPGGGGSGGGPECVMAETCGMDTTCQAFTCKAGVCGTDDAMPGKPCSEGGGELCDGMGKCVPPTCMDGFKNGGESDTDCGGPCGKCADGKSCATTGDCQNGLYCAMNGGGPGTCKPVRALGDGCLGAEECGANFCTDGVCCKQAKCIDGCWTCALSGDGTCSAHEGAPCGDPTSNECTAPDTCNNLGNCQANHVMAGMPCGDGTDSECTAADSCDGAGKCKSNHMAVNTPCGSSTSDQCTASDSCDGNGACLSHDVGNGTVCGGKCVGDTLSPAGTCTAGVCSSQGSLCPGGYACNAAQTACNLSCAGSADCAANNLCLAMMNKCVACGTLPPPPYTCVAGAGGCETCDASNFCIKTCDTANECTASKVLGGMGMGVPPARLECKGQCNNITVSCQGPVGCEVVCENGGCTNLHLNCDLNGPCKLTCHGNSCAGAIVGCGDNTCDVSCDQATAITHTCNQACSCLDTGCQ